MKKTVTRLVLTCAIGLLPCHTETAAVAAVTMNGKRVILDETFQFWVTKEAADQTLARIKTAGFNVYVPVVWYGGGTTWPSSLAPRDPRVLEAMSDGFDPLGYVISKAHSMGIEVHPWFTVALRQFDLLPQFALEGQLEGGRLGIFDLHNPGFRSLIVDLIAEVVSTYKVDGINLDYVRMMGLCTHEACRKEYRAKYGRDLTVDAVTFLTAPQLVPTLIDYQESTVTGLVRAISERTRKIKPQVVISADAHPELVDYLQGQNSVDWANRGYIDVLFRMDYNAVIDYASTDLVRTRLATPDCLTVLVGNYDFIPDGAQPRSGQWLVKTISGLASRWPRTGAAVYLYNQLSDEQVEALRQWDMRKSSKRTLSPPTGLRAQ